MNFIKVKISLAFALTFCWAILCFKPAYALIELTGNAHKEGLTIGDGGADITLTVDGNASTTTVTISDGGSATYSGYSSATDTTVEGGVLLSKENSTLTNTTMNGGNLSVINNGTTKNSSINTGSMATFEDDAKGYDTTIAGGTVEISGRAILDTEDGTNIIQTGSLTIKDSAEAKNFILEAGNASVSGGILSDSIVTGNFSINVGDSANPNVTSGTIENVTIQNGGNLVLYDETGTVGGSIDNVIVESGGKLISNNSDSKFSAKEISVKSGGSFTLSTNDSINTIKTTSTDGTEYTGNILGNIADKIYVGSGSTFTVKEDGQAQNFVIDQGIINIEINGSIKDSAVNSATANIEGTAENITFKGNAQMQAKSGSSVSNASFLDNTTVDIENYSSLKDSITIGNNVLGFNAEELFKDGTSLTQMTLVGGINSAFADGIINNDSSDHNLILNEGVFNPNNIKNWKGLSLVNAQLYVNNDITMKDDGDISIDNNSSLFASGNITIQNGDVKNSGTINLVRNNNNVVDSLIIDGNYEGDDGRLNLNVDISSAQADNIIIKGTASGNTSVYLTPLNEGSALRDDILFAQADNTSGENVFNIYRVEGSYLQWDTVFKDNKWYASLKNVVKDGKYVIVPEAAAYYGLIDNTFIQTSSLGESLRNNIAISEYQKVPCRNIKRGQNKICRSNRPVFSGWLAPAATSVNIETPYVYDAEVNGFDAGLDLISNGYTKLGLLASYRQGKYNYEENGDEYEIMGTAETTINSYLAGAYLRHDSKNWSTILAGYAGKLDVDMSTDDDINTSTSGTTYGATLDISYIYNNIRGIRIEPGIRISYTAVELDAVEDNGGKTQEFDNASRTEFEAGIKFAKRWEFSDSRAEIFVKPSIIKIMDDTSDFILEKEKSLSAADDQTIAKLSAGISFDMTSSLSASLAGSYSMGNDYKNASGNLSVMYKF